MARFAVLLVFVGILGTACGDGPATPAKAAAPAAAGAESDVLSSDRMLVRTAQIDIRVPDREEARTAIEDLVRTRGGYTELSEIHNRLSGATSRLVVRVPADELDGVLEQIRALAAGTEREVTQV